MKILEVNGEQVKLKLSHSFIETAQCPLALKLRYVDHADDRFVRVAAERGKAAHSAIEELITYCLEEECEVSDIDDEMIREAVQKHTPHQVLSEVGLVFSWVQLWRARFKLPKDIYGHEERIALDDEFDECAWDDASYRGVIDLLQVKNSTAIITDWKSQPHILSQTDLDEHEQLTMYGWLVSKMYPHIKTFKVRLWYLRYGFYAETVRTAEQLTAFEHALMIKERKIAEIDNWDPIPGKHCQYCDFVHRCPLALDLSPDTMQVVATQEQAIIAAQRLTVMDALSKEIKARLKQYVERNDDVAIGDSWTYGFRKSTSESWDATEVAEVLRPHDLALADYVNIDSRAIKKLIKMSEKENPVLAGELQDVTHEKHSTRFEGYKRKKE